VGPIYLVKVEGVRVDNSRPAPLFIRIVGPSPETRAAERTKKERDDVSDQHAIEEVPMFAVDQDRDELRQVREQSFSDLGVLERPDFQEWIVERPSVLGEEFLVIQSEYSKFADTRDRLDLLALDREGRLVVVELKRDEADDTTDLQAIKYASYCATLTAEEIQQDYRSF
jgi:RecB family endonuclease NucS